MEPNTEYIAFIGDVHGDSESLKKILTELKQLDVTIFAAGDLFDRGPNSKEVAELFISNNIYSVLGNHDDSFNDVMRTNPPYLTSSYHSFIFPGMGGASTVRSFLNTDEPIDYKDIEFKQSVSREIKNYVGSFPVIRIIEFSGLKFLLNHAGINQQAYQFFKPDFEKFELLQDEDELLNRIDNSFWRDDIIWNHKYYCRNYASINGFIQVVGHMPTDEVEYESHVLRMDTGCGKDLVGSRLSCALFCKGAKAFEVFDSLGNARMVDIIM